MNPVGRPAVEECVIVGGGIIGLSLAFELLERGLRVLVLERGEAGHGATHASAGMLAPISEAELEPAEFIALAFDSRGRYRETVERWERDGEIDCGYRDEGTLWVATTRDEHEELRHLAESLRLKGLTADSLSAADLVEREPHLSPRALSGLYVAEDHQIDPRATVRCLTNAIRQRGGQIATGARVSQIVSANAGWYMMPDYEQDFPYGLRGSAVSREKIRQALQLPVTILLGEKDNDPEHPNLRRTPEAMTQGENRFARGHSFFDAALAYSEQVDVPFNWQLVMVPEADHDNSLMAPAAIPYLLNE